MLTHRSNKYVVCVNAHHRKSAAFGAELVSGAGEFLLANEQLLTRNEPFFAVNNRRQCDSDSSPGTTNPASSLSPAQAGVRDCQDGGLGQST